MEQNFFQKIKNFIRKIDPKSWPAFVMFAVVLVAAGALNYAGMSPTFGSLIALTVAAFFGFGVLSWHVVESRTDDSEEQEQIALVAKWVVVVLDAILLVVNFIRIETASYGWDILAYVIISVAAVTHVVCYLLWTQASPNRAISRELERNLSNILRTGNKSEAVIKATEAKLRVHKHVADEEIRLREEYKSLPAEQVNALVSAMRRDAYAKLDELSGVKPKQQPADDGKTRQVSSNLKPTAALAAETHAERLDTDPNAHRGGK